MNPSLSTPICELFGVRYPIVQTGMGWVSGARLTAATAEAGGMGFLASATMTLAELETAIGKVKERTSNPFGVNLLPNQSDLDDRLQMMVDTKISSASFAGAPSAEVVAKLNEANITSVVTVGAPRHAEKMRERGVTAVIAQGGEGGGHTGSIPTTLLLPGVVDAAGDMPVIAAGGFFDGRGLVAALAYGAQGVAMGTRFLLSAESTVPDNIKDIYVKTPLVGTVVTEAIDGAPQRVIRTDLIEGLESGLGVSRFPKALANALRFRSQTGTSFKDLLTTGLAMRRDQDLSWSQLALAANAPMLTKESMVNGRPEVGILPTGQVVGSIDELPSVESIIEDIVSQAEAVLARLAG